MRRELKLKWDSGDCLPTACSCQCNYHAASVMGETWTASPVFFRPEDYCYRLIFL
jgi:hypothetical protein